MTDSNTLRSEPSISKAVSGWGAVVAGVGATGRQVAMMLAALGVRNILIFDNDTVEEKNVAAQGYGDTDVGDLKTDACRLAMEAVTLEKSVIVAEATRFRAVRMTEILNKWCNDYGAVERVALFNCVDSMQARKHIRTSSFFDPRVAVMLDSRLNGETMRFLTVVNDRFQGVASAQQTGTGDWYAKPLYSNQEVEDGGGGVCTTASTFYAASVCAGLLVGAFTKYARGIPQPRDWQLMIASTELSRPAGTLNDIRETLVDPLGLLA